jgi:crotonobetainyl-CoA:carnitine CoA-transferase CaiB-like acyl-CoA transferase
VFERGDGRQISLGVVQQAQFEALARALKRERLARDPRFANPDLRRQNSRAMRAELEAVFATQAGIAVGAQLSEPACPAAWCATSARP